MNDDAIGGEGLIPEQIAIGIVAHLGFPLHHHVVGILKTLLATAANLRFRIPGIPPETDSSCDHTFLAGNVLMHPLRDLELLALGMVVANIVSPRMAQEIAPEI